MLHFYIVNYVAATKWPQMTLKQQIVQQYIKYLTHMPDFVRCYAKTFQSLNLKFW